ncbi:MAG: hypothetical protein M3Q30_01590 [Actinomycetota bacterium]|nr:hypothetical protein [Actinomycetota bacterium]
MIIVDDQLLLSILAGQESDLLLSARSNGVATTMCWFYRLSRAIAAGSTTGALSRRFSALSTAQQTDVITLVDELPAEIITLDSRTVVPVMSALSSVASANVLTTEAVATALVTALDEDTVAKVADLGLADSRSTHPRRSSEIANSTKPSSTRQPSPSFDLRATILYPTATSASPGLHCGCSSM